MRATCSTLISALLLVIAVGSVATGSTARAAEADLESALARLATAIEREPNLSAEFRGALAGVVTALRTQARPLAAPQAASAKVNFWERFRPSADLRLRHEQDRRNGPDDRNRERVRFRIGAEVNLGSGLSAGVRARTGPPTDAPSPYHNFGNMLDSLEFNLDRVYLRYAPSFLPGASIVAGKFRHPFLTNPVYGELVWDADANPEGIAGLYQMRTENGLELRAAAGEYLLAAQDAGDEVSIFAAQGSARAQLSDRWDLRAAVGWYRYTDTEPDGTTVPVAENSGNLTLPLGMTPTAFASDFRILNPIASLRYSGPRFPITLAGEYIVNTGADGASDADEGFAAGISLGESDSPGEWKFYYQFQRVEQDAVFSPFAQDDFLRSTNFRGHVLGVDYRVTERLGVRAWGLVSRAERSMAGAPDDDDVRLRLDLDARF